MTAYLVGGGIASLAAATFLIRDAGLDGSQIRILEELHIAGGALDGAGDPDTGYVSRGTRMLGEETCACLWDLLGSIPTLTDPGTTVKQEIWDFNRTRYTDAGARLVDADHEILDAASLGLDARDRADLMRILALPERAIGARRIDDYFSGHFFRTRFWALWRTTFAFQPWSSAIELKRSFLRFAQEFPRLHTLSGVRRTVLNEYDSIVRPVQQWLTKHGVDFEYGAAVQDVEFEGRRATRIVTAAGGYDLGPGDYVFVTLGSMTADSTYGDDDTPPELTKNGGFRLWERIAEKAADFGRPAAFAGNVDQTKFESFTLTMHSPLLLRRIEGKAPGTGGLTTFVDSGWLMSIVVPHQPYFVGQPDDVFTLWGYGLLPDRVGDHVRKPMAEATGREILTELVHQLGFEDDLAEIRRSTRVIPVTMPYVTSPLQPRHVEDRPLVVPRDARNFAFLGQYVEVPEDVVFTVEYSVRGAMHAVYQLFHIDREIPGVYHALAHPHVAFEALKAALGAGH
ncbi:oleate hydratase [Nonomuraea sp. NPDC050556]|uniref:oleate hydratase n=1 Tax=Nonomuraea sp. NPDC050556 TaxID=3364369 RepID=UPI0037B9E52F